MPLKCTSPSGRHRFPSGADPCRYCGIGYGELDELRRKEAAAKYKARKLFRAVAWGYDYQWEIVSQVITDAFGRPFVWAKPVKKFPGHKRGSLRAPVVWHLTTLPPEIRHAC